MTMFLCVGKYIGHSRVHGNPVLDPCRRRDDENLKDLEKSSGDFSVYRAFQGDDNKHVCLFKLKALVLSCVFIFCFEGIARPYKTARPYKETFSSLTRTPAVTTPEKHSVRSSVWQLSIPEGDGTGFFITANKFITNFHVINGLLQHVSKVEDITLSQEGNAKTLKIKGIVAVSALHDLALLETTESIDYYLSIRQEPLQEQEDLFSTGYPDGKLADIRKTNDRLMFSRDATSFFVNHFSLHGASGSPVVDAKKQVVGVLRSGISNLIISVNLNDLQVFVQEGLRNVPRDNLEQMIQREIQNLRNLAERKNAHAQFKLGVMYYKGLGLGMTQNYEKAAELFQQAAEQGHALAQNNLGFMYYHGEGVTQNFEKAADLFRQAAEQGDAQGQYLLGGMYYHGEGVTQNFEMAAHWYTKAAEQGYALAQYMLGGMYYHGEGVTQNDEKAAHWYTKAAEQGHTQAQYNLAWSYYHGKGVTKSYEKAADWLKQAAEQGHPEAQYMLGVMYKEGEGVTQNDEKAVDWYTKAAEQGHPGAQSALTKFNNM